MSLSSKDFLSRRRLKNAELGPVNDPEATMKRKAKERERERHFPGCHGNIPAPHHSIIPEHRDMSLSDVEEAQEKETQSNGRAERHVSHRVTRKIPTE